MSSLAAACFSSRTDSVGGGVDVGNGSAVTSKTGSGARCVSSGARDSVRGAGEDGSSWVRGAVDAGGGTTTGAGVGRDWVGAGDGAGVIGDVVSGSGSRSAGGGGSRRKSRSSGGVVVVASWASAAGAMADTSANAMKKVFIGCDARGNLAIDVAFSMLLALNPP